MKNYFDEFYAFAKGQTTVDPPPSQQGDLDWFDSFGKQTEQNEETDVTPQGLDRLVKDEGERLKVYKDTKGLDTIGVGFNLEEGTNKSIFEEVVGFSVDEARAGRAITKEQSRELLRRTVANAEKEAAVLVEPFDRLKPEQQDAITNFVFNVGFKTASEFKNTLAAINRGDGKAAAANIRKSKYYQQVGARGERVAKVLETIGGS